MKYSLLNILACSVMLLALSGCGPRATPRAQPRQQHVDVRAQQQYYDKGLQHYSRENYGEAKAAFEKVIEYGPATSLGIKAQENLKKIQRIMKTLEEIESK